MSSIRRRPAETDTEMKLITALIVSTKFCTDIFPLLDPQYFQISFGKRVVGWIKDYYNQYGESPGKHIRDIFKSEKASIKEAESELIEAFLAKLSENYEELESFNVEYVLDQSVAYLNTRALKTISENVNTLLGAGKPEQAEKEMQGYHKVAKIVSSWIDPFTQKAVRAVFDEEGTHLIKFPGKLGELLGWFDRGWFLSIMGPWKRGKTWLLQEIGIQALLAKQKVVFISLEMGANRVIRRIYKEIVGKGDTSGDFIFPCFDCLLNQDGSCESKHRTNTVTLLEQGKAPNFIKGSKYKPCTYCRDYGLDTYQPATWYEMYSKDKMEVKDTIKTIKSFRSMYGGRLRVKSYPRFSANISDIKRDLDILAYTEDFIPDVIVVDYADILAPEDSRLSERRDRIDDTWKTLGGMAEERHCLLVTASQSNRGSADKKNVKASDAAEDIRKMAHVDLMISLSQTPEEKRRGIMRIGAAAHREEYFDESKQVQVLQQLAFGQPNLDSETYVSKKESKESK